jgi:hypothetical protein
VVGHAPLHQYSGGYGTREDPYLIAFLPGSLVLKLGAMLSFLCFLGPLCKYCSIDDNKNAAIKVC